MMKEFKPATLMHSSVLFCGAKANYIRALVPEVKASTGNKTVDGNKTAEGNKTVDGNTTVGGNSTETKSEQELFFLL